MKIYFFPNPYGAAAGNSSLLTQKLTCFFHQSRGKAATPFAGALAGQCSKESLFKALRCGGLRPSIFVNFHQRQAMSHCLMETPPLGIRVKTFGTPSTRQNLFPFTSFHIYSCFILPER